MEDRLAAETLEWLRSEAVTAPRAVASTAASRLAQRWSRVYFAPRWAHGNLRFDKYSTAPVRRAQARILDHLKRRYFELHEYHRYLSYASQSAMHRTAEGTLPPQLVEFRTRLENRSPAVDELRPLIDAIGKDL